MEKAFRWLATASEKKPWIVMGAILLVTVLAFAGMTRLHQEYGYKIMLPKNKESVQTMEEQEDIFGGVSEETVLLQAEDVLRGDILRKVAGFRGFLAEKPDMIGHFITEVITPLDSMVFFDTSCDTPQPADGGRVPLSSRVDELNDGELQQQAELNLAYSRMQAEKAGLPGGGSRYVSQHRDALRITGRLDPGMKTNVQMGLATPFEDYTREYFGVLPATDTYITGYASTNKDSNEKTMKDTGFLFLMAMVFIVMVLFITFRRVSDILLTLLVIILTIIWVFGFAGWVGFPFSYNSSGIMPLLLGIDIAYAIHVLTRYYEERRKGGDPQGSAVTSVVTVGVAVFLTAATTAFGFASFGISNMPPIQQFGALCVAGVIFAFILAVTLLPASLVLRDRRGRAREKWDRKEEKMADRWKSSLLDRVLVKIAVLSEHHRLAVGVSTVIVIAACIVLGFQVSTEADMTKMMPQDMPSRVASSKVEEAFGGQDIAYSLVKGDILEPEDLLSMLEFEDLISSSHYLNEAGEPLILRDRVVSIADIALQAGGGTIPATREEVIASLLTLQKNGGAGGNELVSDDQMTAMITARVSRGSQEDMAHIAEVMRGAADQVTMDNPAITISNSGFPILINDIMGTLVPTQLKTSGLALLLCTLVVILVFKSFFFGLAATSVVFISIAVELGCLAILGWPLDFMTVMVSSLVIGAGIDFGIHVTHRFREEWHRGGVEIDEAMRRTVTNVGKALLAAAVTTAGAFAIIATSSISYMRRFGGITAISLVVALLSSLLVLPSLLAWRAQNTEKKHAGRRDESQP
ncbi:MAG: RND family transporter [Actinobacteria bacterium]|nr:MAG: RND family transporter [Actinomycetota bacterium]